MSYKTQTNSGSSIDMTAEQDGAINAVVLSGQNFIFKGIGDEFSIVTNSSSLNVTVNSGEGAICGRTIRSDVPNSITLPASSTLYLVLRIDLTQPTGSEGLLYSLTSSSLIKKENLNSNGTINDMLLAVITTTANGVSNVVDKRIIKGNIYQYGTELPETASEGDIFFLYEA